MSRILLLCSFLAFVGCAGSEEAAETAEESTAATISLADVAGTWSLTAMPADADSALTTFEMVATDSMDGWTMRFPDRDPVAMRVVAVEGDSIVTEAGPFESVLRPGVMVSVRSVTRLEGDMMMGTFTAHYDTEGADSVMSGRLHGMRAMN